MKTAIWIYLSALLIATVLAIAIGSSAGDPDDSQFMETRDLAGFTEVILFNDIELEIAQGDSFLVEVAASDDALSGLRTRLDGQTLDIRRGAGSGRFFGMFRVKYLVRVTLPELESLTVIGDGEADGVNTFTGESIRIAARFGSEIDLDVDVTSIDIEAVAGSDIDLTGSADTAVITASAGSDVSGGEFVARDVAVNLSTGSELFLTVMDGITGSVSFGSVLVHQGNPPRVEVSATNGAEIVGI